MRSLLFVSVLALLLMPVADVGAQLPHREVPQGTGPAKIPSGTPLGGVPVGTILPYIGPFESLPSEWLPCDGRTVRDSDSPLNGVELPNLADNRFLMGVESAEMVGVLAGTNSIPQAGRHGHNGTTAGRIRELTGMPRRMVNSGDRSLQHTHQIQIQSGGGHDHGAENRPQFFGVRFIVKVK